MRRAYTVALTGGVAAGKGLVCDYFRARNVPIYDADVAAREVVEPGSATLERIVLAFGKDVLAADGSLDRAAMRARIFDDVQTRRQLEGIVHPAVADWLHARVETDTQPYCILAIPLLAETWPKYAWVDRILVVDAPESSQIERLMRRDGIDAALARNMIEAQAPRPARLALADDVIDNSGPISAVEEQVEDLHEEYSALAAAARPGRQAPGIP